MNYYCYIAGLPDIQIDNGKSIPTMEDILADLLPMLSSRDKKLLNILRRKYDNENLMKVLNHKDDELSPLGLLSAQDWAEIINIIDESDELNPPHDRRLIKYMLAFYKYFKSDKTEKAATFDEEYLASLYYKYGMECNNKFVVDWFEFNLNINNILTALTCRKHDWDIKAAVVGDNIIARTIKESITARDFNLKSEIDYFDAVQTIFDTTNLLEREHKLDALKWRWLDEQTFFNTFSIERVLVFWLKCEMLHRWDNLSMEEGAEIFRNMINDLKKDVKFD